MKITKIAIPIYYGHLRIVVTDDFDESSKTLGIDHKGKDPNSFGAFVTTWTSGIGLEFFTVFFKPDVSHMLIAHEVVHLVNSIYVHRNMELDKNNDEPQAYLTGWITEQIYKALKK